MESSRGGEKQTFRAGTTHRETITAVAVHECNNITGEKNVHILIRVRAYDDRCVSGRPSSRSGPAAAAVVPTMDGFSRFVRSSAACRNHGGNTSCSATAIAQTAAITVDAARTPVHPFLRFLLEAGLLSPPATHTR